MIGSADIYVFILYSLFGYCYFIFKIEIGLIKNTFSGRLSEVRIYQERKFYQCLFGVYGLIIFKLLEPEDYNKL